MPGPPVVPFYLRRHLAPKVARASMLLIFFGTAIAGTLAALWVGIATGRLFLLSLLLFPPMWLGNRIGARHFGSVPPRVWQTMVAVVLSSEEHTSELQSLMRLSYAVFCLNKKNCRPMDLYEVLCLNGKGCRRIVEK